MILERKNKLYFDPKKKKTVESFKMVMHSFGNTDPTEKIAELSGYSVNEIQRLMGIVGFVYESLLLKGYTLQFGNIAKMSLYADSKSFSEEDQWMAMKESVKAIRLKTLTTGSFKRKLKEVLQNTEFQKGEYIYKS